jgi:hypothetical protein
MMVFNLIQWVVVLPLHASVDSVVRNANQSSPVFRLNVEYARWADDNVIELVNSSTMMQEKSVKHSVLTTKFGKFRCRFRFAQYSSGIFCLPHRLNLMSKYECFGESPQNHEKAKQPDKFPELACSGSSGKVIYGYLHCRNVWKKDAEHKQNTASHENS